MLLPPNIVKNGDVDEVEITFFVAPFAQLMSNLMSSPGPVGIFLICSATITEPPHLLSGWPVISESAFGCPGARPVAPAGARVGKKAAPTPVQLEFRMLYEALTSWAAAEIWNSPQAWSTRMLPTMSGARTPA